MKRLRIFERSTKFWSREESFSILLIILLINMFIVIPFVHERRFGKIIIFIFYFLLLSSGLITLVKNKGFIIVSLFTLASLVFIFSEILFTGTWVKVFTDLFGAVFCIALACIVILKTFSEGPISSRRIQGAIVGYLLIGLAFSMLYHSIYLIDGNTSFNGLHSFAHSEFMYFSLTTLTTLGYGDISPVASSARSLSNIEALIGQLYPAILIARLVSMEFISSRNRKAS